MRVSSFAVARPAYYDRNASASSGAYYNTVGPHGTTTRTSYTTPAGQKALIEVANVEFIRSTVATVAGQIDVAYISNTNANDVRLCHLFSTTNTTNVQAIAIMTGSPTIYAGETVVGATSDSSTGGTITYAITHKVTQFDA